MDTIYVTGHRNPDTDSIVAAMAYTELRNACGDWEYQAACLGHVSDETQIVLDRFGFQPPQRIYNLYTQVRDLDFDTPPILSAAVTEGRAWSVLGDSRAENGRLIKIQIPDLGIEIADDLRRVKSEPIQHDLSLI